VAERIGAAVRVDFNGLTILAHPGDTAHEALRLYRMQEKASKP